MNIVWVKRAYDFLFGTRHELSRIHEMNSVQSTLLSQIQVDVRQGFSLLAPKFQEIDSRIETLSARIQHLENELDEVRDMIRYLKKEHLKNHVEE